MGVLYGQSSTRQIETNEYCLGVIIIKSIGPMLAIW